MTEMSRLPCLPLSRFRDNSLVSSFFYRWHIICIPTGLSGCIFPLPLIMETENVPPTIEASSPGEGETLLVDIAVVSPFVVATDEDGDTLTCLWSIDQFGALGPGEPIPSGDLQGCQLDLVRDSEHDGHTLTVRVFDPSADFAERSWPIDVVEEVQ